MEKKPYFFCMTVCHHRTGAHIGKRCGVVFASDSEEAERLVWNEYGGDNVCQLWVDEVLSSGYDFTVYKSEI